MRGVVTGVARSEVSGVATGVEFWFYGSITRVSLLFPRYACRYRGEDGGVIAEMREDSCRMDWCECVRKSVGFR